MLNLNIDFTPLFSGENEKLVIFGQFKTTKWEGVNHYYSKEQEMVSTVDVTYHTFLKRTQFFPGF
jgi:hypothetical protein